MISLHRLHHLSIFHITTFLCQFNIVWCQSKSLILTVSGVGERWIWVAPVHYLWTKISIRTVITNSLSSLILVRSRRTQCAKLCNKTTPFLKINWNIIGSIADFCPRNISVQGDNLLPNRQHLAWKVHNFLFIWKIILPSVPLEIVPTSQRYLLPPLQAYPASHGYTLRDNNCHYILCKSRKDMVLHTLLNKSDQNK